MNRRPHLVAWMLLAFSLTGIAIFARGLDLVSTIGLLVSGAVAGASIAALAASRGKKR